MLSMIALGWRRVGIVVAMVLVVTGLTTAAMAVPTIVSDFETGLDGWTVSNALAVHQTTGGNPGGYFFFDNPESTISVISAPAKFRGDLRTFDGGALSFDGNLLQQLAPDYTGYGTVTISGPGGSATRDIVQGQPPVGQWVTHSETLDATTWGKSQVQWEAILQNVTSLTIVIEAVFGGEQNGVDNIKLVPAPLAGDLNGDCFVGINDLNIVLGNWNQAVTPGDILLGDPTGDGFVGIADLNVVLGNWNAGTPPTQNSSIPEPGTVLLFSFAALIGLQKRYR